MAVHRAVALLAAKLLLRNIEECGRPFVLKCAGKRVRLKKTTHIGSALSLDSCFYYAINSAERVPYPARILGKAVHDLYKKRQNGAGALLSCIMMPLSFLLLIQAF